MKLSVILEKLLTAGLPYDGGSNDDDNLVACCRYCNTSKGAKPLGEWRAHH